MVFVSPISGARRPDILKKIFFLLCCKLQWYQEELKEIIKCNCHTHVLIFSLSIFSQELVTKVFQQMWFSPLKGEENSDVFVKRVVHMTDVVSAQVISLTFKSFSFI